MAQDFAKAFYNSAAWISCRKSYAKSVGNLCERCLARGLIVPGKVVHHIRHIKPENIDDPNVTLSYNNLILVCQDCHAAEHKSRGRYVVGSDGSILPPIDKSI